MCVVAVFADATVIARGVRFRSKFYFRVKNFSGEADYWPVLTLLDSNYTEAEHTGKYWSIFLGQ